MSDDGEDHHDAGESADEEFESERTATRAEAAAVLRGLADGVDAGTVAIGDDEDAISVSVPDEFDLEVEFEREDDEAEIEVELEWSTEETGDEAAAAGAEGDEAATDERPAVETATVSEAPGSSPGSDEPAADDETAAAEDPTADEAAETDAAGEAAESADGEESAGTDAETAEPSPVVAADAPLESLARFELFRDRADEWRWRLVHRNGNVIASSGEGYTRRRDAEKGLASVMRNAPDADVVEED